MTVTQKMPRYPGLLTLVTVVTEALLLLFTKKEKERTGIGTAEHRHHRHHRQQVGSFK
jgi:hypothetical protein